MLIKQDVIGLNPRSLDPESIYSATALTVLLMTLAKITTIIGLEVTRT